MNTPINMQLVSIDQLFDAFNANNSWLKNSIKQFIEDEDALFDSETPELLNRDYLNDCDEYIHIRNVTSGYGDRFRIAFSGFGFRRGVLLMNDIYLDSKVEEDLTSNWYFGFTIAGNGTPAHIFPVADEISRYLAKEVLKRVIL